MEINNVDERLKLIAETENLGFLKTLFKFKNKIGDSKEFTHNYINTDTTNNENSYIKDLSSLNITHSKDYSKEILIKLDESKYKLLQNDINILTPIRGTDSNGNKSKSMFSELSLNSSNKCSDKYKSINYINNYLNTDSTPLNSKSKKELNTNINKLTKKPDDEYKNLIYKKLVQKDYLLNNKNKNNKELNNNEKESKNSLKMRLSLEQIKAINLSNLSSSYTTKNINSQYNSIILNPNSIKKKVNPNNKNTSKNNTLNNTLVNVKKMKIKDIESKKISEIRNKLEKNCENYLNYTLNTERQHDIRYKDLSTQINLNETENKENQLNNKNKNEINKNQAKKTINVENITVKIIEPKKTKKMPKIKVSSRCKTKLQQKTKFTLDDQNKLNKTKIISNSNRNLQNKFKGFEIPEKKVIKDNIQKNNIIFNKNLLNIDYYLSSILKKK